MAPPTESLATLFGELAELSAPERAARLAALDGRDAALARELRSLLDADADAPDFLGVGGVPATPAPVRASGAPGAYRPEDEEAAAAPLAPGAAVGPYRLDRVLGRGGMATVWLAHDGRLDRPVALKFLGRDEGGAPPPSRGRFLVEARAAAALDHPHVAPVYDVGEAGGRLYIAMAYCPGGSLADHLAAGPLPPAAAARVGAEVAAALGAAHARGVVHRDVKPANVLFDASGAARLGDFGIATLPSPGRDVTLPGLVLGTVAYLAPEQVRGERAGPAADLWALGVTLYEALAGRRPFAGDSPAAVLHAVLAARPEPLARAAPGTPPALAALVARLLAADPAGRPTSADEVADALRAAAAGGAGAAAGTSGDRSGAPLGAPLGAPSGAPSGDRSGAAFGTAPAPAALLAPLVGRVRELADAAALLAGARLLTLTGPGGTGKTRLALALAAAARPAGGAHVVPLAAVASADLVPAAVAASLGLRAPGAARPEDEVASHLAGRGEALLVLDNCEHVLDAAPFVAALLAAAPRLTVLATSRAPLRLGVEQEFPVPPLALPPPDAATADAVGASEAARLFVQRARAGRPDFALTDANAADVAAVCRRLDGLPLAIELAAARARLLSPRAILARLEHRFDILRSDARDTEPRHRTLRGAIDWSYALLTPEEQRLFGALAVCAGGFTLDAAEALAAAAGVGADDALDRVASLCDKSLLVRREQPDGEPRFHLLETVREYALARLADAGGEDAARRAHGAHFLALAEEGARHLRGPDQLAWLERLEREQPNLRAALDHAEARGDDEAAARLGVALHRFWAMTSVHLGEVDRLRALEARGRAASAGDASAGDAPAGVSPALHARLLSALGHLTGVRCEFDVSRTYYDSAVAAYRALGDAEGAATALNFLSWLAYRAGDFGPARAQAEEALAAHAARERAGAAEAATGVAVSHNNLGWIALARGRLAEAEGHFAESLAIHRRRSDRRSAAYALVALGATAHARGDYAAAAARYDEALALGAPLGDRFFGPPARVRALWARHDAGEPGAARALADEVMPPLREVGHVFPIALALTCLGAVLGEAAAGGDAAALEAARAALDEAVALHRGMGNRAGEDECVALLAEVDRRAGRPAEAAARWRACLTARHARGEALGVAACLDGVARLAADQGDDATAAQLLAGAAAERGRLGAAVPPRAAPARAALHAALERRMGAVPFACAGRAGAAAAPDGLVALALAACDAAGAAGAAASPPVDGA